MGNDNKGKITQIGVYYTIHNSKLYYNKTLQLVELCIEKVCLLGFNIRS